MLTKYKHLLIPLMLIGLILAAFALRVYHLDYQSLWRDEVDAIRFSNWSLPALLKGLIQKGHNGPLYFFVLRGWRTLTGDSEFALRYFSVVGGVLMVALTYAVGRRFKLGLFTPALAALWVATSPYLIWYSQESKMYTWLGSLILMAVYAYQTALQTDSTTSKDNKSTKWWIIFVVTTSLSFYTHILAPLMLGVYVIWAGIQWSRVKKQLNNWLMAIGILTLPYLPLAWWQAPLFLEGEVSGHPFYSYGKQMSLLVYFYSGGILQSDYSLLLRVGTVFIILIGLLFPLLWYGSLNHFNKAVWLSAWFIIPTNVVYLVSLRIHIFEDRYLIYIAPAFYLLLALGMVLITARIKVIGIPLIVVFLSFNIWAISRQAGNIIKADFRGVATYITQSIHEGTTVFNPPLVNPVKSPVKTPTINQEFNTYFSLIQHKPEVEAPVVMFQMPYIQHTFDYYFKHPYEPRGGLWTNDGKSKAEVAQEMKTNTANLKTLWLVVSEEQSWDGRQLMRKWLDNNAILVDVQHFNFVSVYQYQFSTTNR